MKRVAVYIFLLILATNLVGSYLYFGVRMLQIHDEKRAELKTKDLSELEVITLSIKQFRKALVEDDEMELNNKMYDIARTETKGNSIIVYCLHDVDEDNLLSLLDSILNNSSKDKKPVPPQLSQLLAITPGTQNFYCSNSTAVISHTTFYQTTIYQFDVAIDSPPPQG